MVSVYWYYVSALVLSTNSFMQRPVGFKIVENDIIGKKQGSWILFL